MTELSAKAGMRPGVDVVIGGKLYIAPPLNFGAIRDMLDLKQTHPYDLLVFVLVHSLKRNYDGVDALWIRENLEGDEIETAALAEVEIMRLSGLKVPDEAKPGEAPAVAG